MIIEPFISKDGPRWRLLGNNGEKLATSEAYSSKYKCMERVYAIDDCCELGKCRIRYHKSWDKKKGKK